MRFKSSSTCFFLHLSPSTTPEAPSLLVYFFDKRCLGTGKCLHVLHVAAEVTNLIERIPRGHLNKHLARHIRNGHCHVERVSLWMIQAHDILNGGLAGS